MSAITLLLLVSLSEPRRRPHKLYAGVAVFHRSISNRFSLRRIGNGGLLSCWLL